MKHIIGLNKVTARSYVAPWLRTLNTNQAENLLFQIEAKYHWAKRNPEWNTDTNFEAALVKFCYRKIKKIVLSGQEKPELSELGSEMKRYSWPTGANCYFEKFLRTGWSLLDGNASYNMTWHNENEFKLCSYCEGDVTIYHCGTKEVYDKEVKAVKEWFLEN